MHLDQSEDVTTCISQSEMRCTTTNWTTVRTGRERCSCARPVLWQERCLGLWHSSWQSCLQMTCVSVFWPLRLLLPSCDLVVATKDWDEPLRCSLCSSRHKTLITVTTCTKTSADCYSTSFKSYPHVLHIENMWIDIYSILKIQVIWSFLASL